MIFYHEILRECNNPRGKSFQGKNCPEGTTLLITHWNAYPNIVKPDAVGPLNEACGGPCSDCKALATKSSGIIIHDDFSEAAYNSAKAGGEKTAEFLVEPAKPIK